MPELLSWKPYRQCLTMLESPITARSRLLKFKALLKKFFVLSTTFLREKNVATKQTTSPKLHLMQLGSKTILLTNFKIITNSNNRFRTTGIRL